VAVITGSSRGLGAGLAVHFAGRGFRLGLCGRNRPESPPGADALVAALDVGDAAAVDRLADEVVARFGRIDLWVNNAGVLDPIGPLADADPTALERHVTTNVLGGAVLPVGLAPYTLAGGAPYNATGGPYVGPPTLAQFALPGQPSARQPGNTPSLYATQVGGLRQLELGWSRPGASLEERIPQGARDFSSFSALSFRAALNFTDWRNYSPFADFDVVLTDTAGRAAAVPVSAWSKALAYPPGKIARLPKVEMNGVRIPLSAFKGMDLSAVASVKLVFDRQPSGAVLLTDLAVSD